MTARRVRTGLAAVALAALAPLLVDAQSPELRQQLERIFASRDFAGERFGPAVWMDGGRSYSLLERTDEGSSIVVVNTQSGERDVRVPSSALTPSGVDKPLDVDDYAWSADGHRLLIFTNTERVWRQNTRGDYWVLDLAAKRLRQLGGDALPSSLMFAKFSPDGTRVAYVRDRDLFVEQVDTGAITRLTTRADPYIINGTSDWVYEEELGIRDAFRWSPDGRSIAYWQFDTRGVGTYSLINDTDTLYPSLVTYGYPKPGTTNSAVRVGVVPAAGGATRWMKTPGDPRDTYIAYMEWSADSRTLILQQLNRLQNQNDLLLADAQTGSVRRAHRDTNKAWVDVVDDVRPLDGTKTFTWLSEQDGWRHLYRVSADGSPDTLVTRFDADVISLEALDTSGGTAYIAASPESAIQRYLYRVPLQGGTPQRVSPADEPGWHTYQISPDAHWAFHTWSRADVPPVIQLISLPDHRVVRTLADNAELRQRVAPLTNPPTEFFTVDVGGGVTLDASLVKPPDFDPSRKYPLIVYVYGEPASQAVVDRWGGSRGLFHRALASRGYLVASFDNRGTPAPKGAAWRKVVYGTVGDLSSKEQAAAVRALIAERSYVDGSCVGVWGWSGGGSNTLNAMFRFPDVYKVGVSVAPVPDQRLYDTIYQERYMGTPEGNPDGYRIGSPINFAEGLKGHLLIVHGSGDDNVHYQGTERLVNRLVELGKPFDLMVYPNRTHAISEGRGTTLHIYSLIARYFEDHL